MIQHFIPSIFSVKKNLHVSINLLITIHMKIKLLFYPSVIRFIFFLFPFFFPPTPISFFLFLFLSPRPSRRLGEVHVLHSLFDSYGINLICLVCSLFKSFDSILGVSSVAFCEIWFEMIGNDV